MSETKIKNPFYPKAHLKLHNDRVVNIFEYRDPLVRPYLYRLYDDHINWKEHPGVEVMGYSNEEDPVPKEFELLKFQDSKHLLRAALICPELASVKIKKEVWHEFHWYTKRVLVQDARMSRNRLRNDLRDLQDYMEDPEKWESPVIESTKLKSMLVGLRGTPQVGAPKGGQGPWIPGGRRSKRVPNPNYSGPKPLLKRKKTV